MKVLSLFDWISCGHVALDRAGIKVEKYFAAEIEKFPIQASEKNYPEITRIGDVKRVRYTSQLYWSPIPTELYWDYVKIDLILGWPPCQDLSIAKKNWKWLEWEKSSLFYEFARVLAEVLPKYFLMENVASMKQSEKEKIDKALLEIYPDMVCHKFNSSRVSAQNRKRYYWTNIPGVTEPEDRGILLRDILEDIPMDDPRWRVLDEKYLSDKAKLRLREKSLSITASYHKKTTKNYFEKDEWQIVLWVMQKARWKNDGWLVQDWEKSPTVSSSKFQDNNFVIWRIRGADDLRIHDDQEKSCTLTSHLGTWWNNVPIILWMAMRNRGEWKQPEIQFDEKANSLTTVQTDSMVLLGNTHPSGHGINGNVYHIDGKAPTLTTNKGEWPKISDGYYYRKLTPLECERLQTLPDNYTAGLSDSQRYKAIGNGWTVDVIAHILSFIPQ